MILYFFFTVTGFEEYAPGNISVQILLTLLVKAHCWLLLCRLYYYQYIYWYKQIYENIWMYQRSTPKYTSTIVQMFTTCGGKFLIKKNIGEEFCNTLKNTDVAIGMNTAPVDWSCELKRGIKRMRLPTGVRINWSWLLLLWSWHGDANRRLLDAVIVVVEERNTFRDVIGSWRAAVIVPVWRNKRFLWLLNTVFITRAFSQTVRTSSPGQVAHDCVVIWTQHHTGVICWTLITVMCRDKDNYQTGSALGHWHHSSHQSLSGDRRHTVRSRRCRTGSSTRCM